MGIAVVLLARHARKQADAAFLPMLTFASGTLAGDSLSAIKHLVSAAIGHHTSNLWSLNVCRLTTPLFRQRLGQKRLLQLLLLFDAIAPNMTAGPANAFGTDGKIR